VLRDAARYVAPALGAPVGTVPSGAYLRRYLRSDYGERTAPAVWRGYWSNGAIVRGDQRALDAVAGVLAVHGWVLGVLLLLAAAGAVVARPRGPAALALAFALALLLAPLLTVHYEARYGLPAAGPLAVAGAWALVAAARYRRNARPG
jgi:hypothetical protein